MAELKFTKWKGILWLMGAGGVPIAYCPNHRLRLEIRDDYDRILSQDINTTGIGHDHLLCPEDGEQFSLEGADTFWALRRRYLATLESQQLKDADIVNLDNVYTPVLKAKPKDKDDKYWVEVRINETKQGKQLVVYAGERGASDKTQIFIDPQNDKISFDQNNMHPNEVFSRVTAYFKDSRQAELESKG